MCKVNEKMHCFELKKINTRIECKQKSNGHMRGCCNMNQCVESWYFNFDCLSYYVYMVSLSFYQFLCTFAALVAFFSTLSIPFRFIPHIAVFYHQDFDRTFAAEFHSNEINIEKSLLKKVDLVELLVENCVLDR